MFSLQEANYSGTLLLEGRDNPFLNVAVALMALL